MKYSKNKDDHGTKAAKGRQDDYAKKYTGKHGSAATGGAWPESPGQGGTAVKGSKFGPTSIKGSNKVAP